MRGEQFIRECFRLAERGRGQVSPNPMVGAVLVKNGKILAKGFHRKFGGLHAEVECLKRAPGDVRDATLYVNLEPCSHLGKTPPCVDLILARGIRSVVAAMKDPNPVVAGRGLRKLQQAGVTTRVGLLEEAARELNRVFATHIVARRPYVHVKIAQSLDGRITGGTSRWISSPESRKRVHAMRAEYDAVLVGAGTVRADDPSLTVRLVKGRDPDVVVLDGAFSLSTGRKLFIPHPSRRVYLVTTQRSLRRNHAKANVLSARGVILLGLPGTGKQLQIGRVMKELYKRNIGSVLVEGGGSVFSQFIAEGLVDELTLFVSPDFIGKGLAAIRPDLSIPRNKLRTARATVGRSGRDFMLNVRYDERNS
jgi:diaminohydroxyphosphoribosylaminopyrimidine deaminase / 5-amino-6-(5-phosphoribosylamino)uracil reductase